MKLYLRIASAVVVVAACSGIASLSLAQEHEEPHRPTTQSSPHVSLESEMHAMSRDFKAIRRQVKDGGKNAATIALVQDLELHTLLSKSCTPDSATTMPTAAERTQKLDAYRSEMIVLLQQELTLEQQLSSGENDKAATTTASLQTLEHQGHDEFRPRDN